MIARNGVSHHRGGGVESQERGLVEVKEPIARLNPPGASNQARRAKAAAQQRRRSAGVVYTDVRKNKLVSVNESYSQHKTKRWRNQQVLRAVFNAAIFYGN